MIWNNVLYFFDVLKFWHSFQEAFYLTYVNLSRCRQGVLRIYVEKIEKVFLFLVCAEKYSPESCDKDRACIPFKLVIVKLYFEIVFLKNHEKSYLLYHLSRKRYCLLYVWLVRNNLFTYITYFQHLWKHLYRKNVTSHLLLVKSLYHVHISYMCTILKKKACDQTFNSYPVLIKYEKSLNTYEYVILMQSIIVFGWWMKHGSLLKCWWIMNNLRGSLEPRL